MKRIKLAHGGGGTLARDFISEKIIKFFDSPHLSSLPDSASIELSGLKLAFTTDGFVVDPIFFPGGDIGTLAVCGTVNDLAAAGSIPRFISCGLIIEAGLPEKDIDRILNSMSEAAAAAGVEVVTGDTKVVPAGKADKIFINTAGIGIIPDGAHVPCGPIHPGDRVIVTGPVGDHGAAIMAQRQGMKMESCIESDCAPVTAAAQSILGAARRVSFMRDVTRGGLATILNEAVSGCDIGIVVTEENIPVRKSVRAVSELLGIDPYYLACEGRLAAVIDARSADKVMEALNGCSEAPGPALIGEASPEYGSKLVAKTAFGSNRLLQMLSGEQLPRIC